jgi:DNA adenine methylase
VTSPLRYPGGKSRALGKILPLVSTDFCEYREPFVGGGSVFVALKQKKPHAKYRINDLNYDLYCFWICVKNHVNDLILEVNRIRNSNIDGITLYKKIAPINDSLDEFHRALRFYVLNRITYSGTVDSGGYSAEAYKRRFTISNIQKLRPLSSLLQDVEITNKSYETLLEQSGKSVFIFMDPPYWKSKKKALYGKNGNLNKTFDHKRFAENVSKCEHKWLITCDDSNIIRELFSFTRRIKPWELRYGMTNVGNNEAIKGKELFISNYLP